MKRFYKVVTMAALPEGAYEIHLNGKPVKLPSRGILQAPNAAIAASVQQEWAAQESEIKPNTMPLTQLLTTAQDRVRLERPAMQAAVAAYLDTDLLCYRASEPPEIAVRQAQLWDPWLEWFAEKYGVRLSTTKDLTALRQPPAAHTAVAAKMAALDDLQFTILQAVVSTTSSLVLGLAFIAGAASPEQLFAAMHAEEDYKAEIYGAARHGFAPHEEKARAEAHADLAAAAFLRDNI